MSGKYFEILTKVACGNTATAERLDMVNLNIFLDKFFYENLI